MKRKGNLWEQIVNFDNIRVAYWNARRHKSSFKSVQKFEKNEEANLLKIQKSLLEKTFKTSRYFEKQVFEPKQRTIYVLPFSPDRIVQHALMNVLIPLFENWFIFDSYACRNGKGQHKGSKKCMEFVRRNTYCLKCDIRKFYPSVNQHILMKQLEQKIKCKDTLWLLRDIVFSFSGDTNVPIGNLTSQWFGNFYMTALDRFVKQELKITDYLRYCDDFCLFSNDKKQLQEARDKIKEFLKNELELEFSKCSLFKTKQGVDFLGYRHFDNYVLVRKSTSKRIKKRLKKLPEKLKSGTISKEQYRSVLASTYGWLKHANTYNFSKYLGLDRLAKELEYE